MKIFNRENDSDVVYVQKMDLTMLSSVNELIPKSVKDAIDSTSFSESSGKDFVKFTSSDEVRFFSSLSWIIDYGKYISAGENYIESVRKDFVKQKDELFKKYEAMTDKEKAKDREVSVEHNLLVYKIRGLDEIIKMRNDESDVKVPLVPNGYKSSFTGDDSIPYEMRPALDPNKILLYRKDGKALSLDEKIPLSFLQMGMSIAMLERENTGYVAGDYDVSRYLSDDNKYFVTEYKLQKYIDEEEIEKSSKEKGFRKVLNRLFKRGNK